MWNSREDVDGDGLMPCLRLDCAPDAGDSRPPGRQRLDPMETPCIDVCVIDREHGLCRGCRRTLDEIAGWAGYAASERRRIMTELPMRRAGRPTPLAGSQGNARTVGE